MGNTPILQVAKDVIASYDTITDLFERMQGFLQRLGIYSGIPLTPAMTEVLGKIMVEVLSIFGLVTKEMKQSGFSELAHSAHDFWLTIG